MGQYSRYDAKENVIFTDLSGLVSGPEVVDSVIDEVIAIAGSLREKVFVVVSWQDAKMEPSLAEHYGQRVQELLNYVRGIVRYAATDIHTRIAIRTQTVKHNFQSSRSHIYSSKEEALSAIRNGEIG